MDLGLAGTSAMVAGASRGLGFAVADALAAEGARVSVAARSADTLEDAAQRLRRHGGEVLAEPVDIRSEDDLERWTARTLEAFGGLDVVVANGGGPPAGNADAVTAQQYREAYDLCVVPMISLVDRALPALRRSGRGRVLVMGSIAIKQPIAALALSNGVRPGLAGYLRSLIAVPANAGVTFNMLAPGLIATERMQQIAGDAPTEELLSMVGGVPAGRLGEPEEVGAVAAFLCSRQAAYVNGAIVSVDGGACRGLL